MTDGQTNDGEVIPTLCRPYFVKMKSKVYNLSHPHLTKSHDNHITCVLFSF